MKFIGRIFLFFCLGIPFYTKAECTSCAASNNFAPSSFAASSFFKEIEEGKNNLPGLKNLIDGTAQNRGDSPYESIKLVECGIIGKTFAIEEISLVELIQQRLLKMKEEGFLAANRKKIQQKVVHSIKNPRAIPGITKATRNHKYIYDPTFTVDQTIYDSKGTLIHPKGKKINPLHHLSFGKPMIFIDGLDKEQVAYATKRQKQEGGKIVLTAGSPMDLSDSLEFALYFDQGGSLTRKFNIHEVPSIVRQSGDMLQIEVVAL